MNTSTMDMRYYYNRTSSIDSMYYHSRTTTVLFSNYPTVLLTILHVLLVPILSRRALLHLEPMSNQSSSRFCPLVQLSCMATLKLGAIVPKMSLVYKNRPENVTNSGTERPGVKSRGWRAPSRFVAVFSQV